MNLSTSCIRMKTLQFVFLRNKVKVSLEIFFPKCQTNSLGDKWQRDVSNGTPCTYIRAQMISISHYKPFLRPRSFNYRSIDQLINGSWMQRWNVCSLSEHINREHFNTRLGAFQYGRCGFQVLISKHKQRVRERRSSRFQSSAVCSSR